jgi:hypothetical protein
MEQKRTELAPFWIVTGRQLRPDLNEKIVDEL